MIAIERKDHDRILVNGKEVRKDMDGTWYAVQEMEMEEVKAFNDFQKCLERCPEIRKMEYVK